MARCRYVGPGGPQCQMPTHEGWTTCARHYSAGRTTARRGGAAKPTQPHTDRKKEQKRRTARRKLKLEEVEL